MVPGAAPASPPTSIHHRAGTDPAAGGRPPHGRALPALPSAGRTPRRPRPIREQGHQRTPNQPEDLRGDDPGRLRRLYGAVKFPPPSDDPIFTNRAQGVAYLGAWLLTVVHVSLWILVAVSVLGSTKLEIGMGVISFAATCLLVWMVIATHRRLDIRHGGTPRHLVTVWWRGPWDPVGRQVWLPVRLPAAWRAARTLA